ncbi:hypothetical protein [Streptomyces sp. NPDC058297]|uniref:hypothetical protein n=1 Tax=Streptomyces sp. NPDC058297 TaxID=3346433 RepID=UPI0036EA80DB
MTDAWGTVIAGIVAGALAFLGSWFGSRRGVADQAKVEHQQWLRGQREAAYVAFLDAWDRANEEMSDLVGEWAELCSHIYDYEGDGVSAMGDSVKEDLDSAMTRMHPAAERVQLIGEKGINEIAAKMTALLWDMGHAIVARLPENTESATWSAYAGKYAEGQTQRKSFLAQAREEMHAEPQPGRSRGWRFPWSRR